MLTKLGFSNIISKSLILSTHGFLAVMLLSCHTVSDDVEARALGMPNAKPEEVGMSSERLARIRPVVQGFIDRQEIPGSVILIARHGRIAHLDALGMMDLEARKPMSTDAIFRIASMTKPITAVAVMMLFEEGHFLLSDPISKFIPEFKNPKVAIPPPPGDKSGAKFITVPAKREITIMDLLTHTSGITSQDKRWLTADLFQQKLEPFLRPETCHPHPDMSLADSMKILATLPLSFHPGTQWGYNWSTDVLGYLVEVVSGMPLDRFFQERIFSQLRMEDTYFFLPEEKASRLTSVYSQSEEEGLKLADSPSRSSWIHGSRRYFIPRGGLVSTATDYVRFCQMLLNMGELDDARVLSRKTVELMTLDHVGRFPPVQRGVGSYGYGLHVGVTTDLIELGTLGSLGAYFWGGAFGTYFHVDPEEELIVIVMTQLASWQNRYRLHDQIRVLAYQSIAD